MYDATFAPGGPGINDVLLSTPGNAGLWASQPSGHWSVSGTTLTGTPAGSSPSFLTRPSAEPANLPIAWGSSQAVIALTPPGGWSASATAWGTALNFSVPGSVPAYYLAEFRPSTVTDRPSSLTISRVDGGTSTSLGSVVWANDTSKDYDLVFESYCSGLGNPIFLAATAIDRATPRPTMADSNHDLAYGPSGVTVLAVIDPAPGLSNGLQGCPAFVALPGTAGAKFARVRLYRGAPLMSFSGRFGPRPVGDDWFIASDGTITPRQATAGTPAGTVFPL